MAAEVLLAAAAARGMLLNFTTREDFRFLLTTGWSCLAIESSFQELEKLLQDVCNKGRSGRSELETDTTLDMVPEAAAAAAVMVKQKTSQPKTQKSRRHKNTHTHTHTHTHRSLRIFFFFFFFFFFNKIPNKLFVRRFTRCLRQCKREEATAKTRSWASSLLLLAAWSSYHCCCCCYCSWLESLRTQITIHFKKLPAFLTPFFSWKKKLQTQVLYRIGDEEHHQRKKKKNSNTEKLWDKDLERERERERERTQGDGVTQQTNKQAIKQSKAKQRKEQRKHKKKAKDL
jgi:hypothetical protein